MVLGWMGRPSVELTKKLASAVIKRSHNEVRRLTVSSFRLMKVRSSLAPRKELTEWRDTPSCQFHQAPSDWLKLASYM